MPNIMALVSQGGFRDLEREHGAVEPGALCPMTAYHSKAKALEGLAAGGTLFLVTVRDGELWLLGALENPTHDGASWVAPPNVVPVRAASHLLAKLQFANGKGIAVPPEKLAMSLQTPRALSDDDTLLLRALALPTAGSAYRAAIASQGAGATSTASGGKRARRPSEAPRSGPVGWAEAVGSIATWSSLDRPTRLAVVEALAAVLGEDFSPRPHLHGVAGLGALEHKSGLEFLVVPGGHMLMGYTADDIVAVMGVFEDDELEDYVTTDWAGYFGPSRPPRAVAVTPFLVSREPVRVEGDPVATLARDGLRILSEAEWEWIAREGGAVQFVGLPTDRHPLGPTISPPVNEEENGWGVKGLHNDEIRVADRWHPDYTGAPPTSAAWETPADLWVGRSGHTWWQGPEEAMALHAAARGCYDSPGDVFRLARTLPAEPTGAAPSWETAVDLTVATMAGKKTPERQRAAVAMLACMLSPGPDSALLAAKVLDQLDALPAARQPELLGRVAAVPEVLTARAERVLALMAHEKPAVRAQAARLAAALGTPAALDRVRIELGKERRNLVRASLVLALHRLTAALDVPAPELEALRWHKDAYVAAAATIALLERGDRSADLMAAAGSSAGLACQPELELPWYGGDLGGRAYRFLTEAGPEAVVAAARSLITAVSRDVSLLEPLVALLFTRHPEIRDLDSLTAIQREAVEAIRRTTDRVPVALVDYGIPARPDLGCYLGEEPPTIVFRSFVLPLDGAEREMPLWQWCRALRARAKAESWPPQRYTGEVDAGLARLDPLERLELHLEMSSMRVILPHDTPEGRGWFPQPRFDVLLAAAREHDTEATLAFGLDYCRRHPTQGEWVAQLFAELTPSGTPLPEACWSSVRFDREADLKLWRRIPPHARQARVVERLRTDLEVGCVEWAEIDALKTLSRLYEVTPAVATAILALGSKQLKWNKATKAAELLAKTDDPAVKQILAEWEGSGASKGGKATQPWVRRALESLEG